MSLSFFYSSESFILIIYSSLWSVRCSRLSFSASMLVSCSICRCMLSTRFISSASTYSDALWVFICGSRSETSMPPGTVGGCCCCCGMMFVCGG